MSSAVTAVTVIRTEKVFGGDLVRFTHQTMTAAIYIPPGAEGPETVPMVMYLQF